MCNSAHKTHNLMDLTHIKHNVHETITKAGINFSYKTVYKS